MPTPEDLAAEATRLADAGVGLRAPPAAAVDHGPAAELAEDPVVEVNVAALEQTGATGSSEAQTGAGDVGVASQDCERVLNSEERAKHRAEFEAHQRKGHRLQIAALVLASIRGANQSYTSGQAASQALADADALLNATEVC